MPTYLYGCDADHNWDVLKPIRDADTEEKCPECGAVGVKRPVMFGFTGASDWNTQSWNPGLGCYTKSHKEAEKIAKRRGLEPIGNEKPETIHKHFERQRAETREQRWADAARDKLYD